MILVGCRSGWCGDHQAARQVCIGYRHHDAWPSLLHPLLPRPGRIPPGLDPIPRYVLTNISHTSHKHCAFYQWPKFTALPVAGVSRPVCCYNKLCNSRCPKSSMIIQELCKSWCHEAFMLLKSFATEGVSRPVCCYKALQQLVSQGLHDNTRTL